MGKTVAELSHELTALEENHWLAYHKRNPFGDERADLRSAQIAQILFNVNVKKEKAKKVTDFMPFHRKKTKKDPNIGDSVRQAFSRLIKKD
ncbi:DUF4035 domain-containing protein [bacterium]|nr:DUF4035 domain-containing protein [bacterium]